ncbi:polysaccharide deacetylase family protein [Vibrio renipiscarius]|uniref:NodB homology domain-containing protein n=1 Tax=Vibrio renipiscarius TaxID=1461322 RepID=A0A0C2JBN4_9VIBR|nr:polysaccharide deacetylase family protein [Vibrio renipiscarius]KII75309.1 hypothetical protein OJ16_18620 [Vibrio renipiscarius]KII78761.1 hypothetical protein PL18_10730 [Vibrio renipiscarius]
MKLALTFDGCEPELTIKLLGLLNQHKAKGSFFVLGSYIKQAEDVIKCLQRGGHLIGGNHYDYLDSTLLDFSEFIEQVHRCTEALKAVTGQMVNYYRPPFGSICNEQCAYLIDYGLTPIFWNVDSTDSSTESAKVENIVGRIMTNVTANSVIRCHLDGNEKSNSILRALKIVIPMLQQCGYEFVTLNEINSHKANQLNGFSRQAIFEV